MFWRDFDKHKPKKEGWYQCSITFGNNSFNQSYVMDLYWYPDRQQFRDNRRQHVFNTYEVFSCSGKRLYTSQLCNRTKDVTGWRKMPKYYVKGSKRKIKLF